MFSSTRSPNKVRNIRMRGKGRKEREEEERRGGVGDNLREWDNQDAGRAKVRARKEIFCLREPLWG